MKSCLARRKLALIWANPTSANHLDYFRRILHHLTFPSLKPKEHRLKQNHSRQVEMHYLSLFYLNMTGFLGFFVTPWHLHGKLSLPFHFCIRASSVLVCSVQMEIFSFLQYQQWQLLEPYKHFHKIETCKIHTSAIYTHFKSFRTLCLISCLTILYCFTFRWSDC